RSPTSQERASSKSRARPTGVARPASPEGGSANRPRPARYSITPSSSPVVPLGSPDGDQPARLSRSPRSHAELVGLSPRVNTSSPPGATGCAGLPAGLLAPDA